MLDDKKISEIKKEAERLIREGMIIKEDKGKFAEFFINNSKEIYML